MVDIIEGIAMVLGGLGIVAVCVWLRYIADTKMYVGPSNPYKFCPTCGSHTFNPKCARCRKMWTLL